MEQVYRNKRTDGALVDYEITVDFFMAKSRNFIYHFTSEFKFFFFIPDPKTDKTFTCSSVFGAENVKHCRCLASLTNFSFLLFYLFRLKQLQINYVKSGTTVCDSIFDSQLIYSKQNDNCTNFLSIENVRGEHCQMVNSFALAKNRFHWNKSRMKWRNLISSLESWLPHFF